jgi:hypothetical protein
MIIDKLYAEGYDFDSLPVEIKQSIDDLTDLRESLGNQSNQKLEVLDLEIFKSIELVDPRNQKVINIRSQLDFDQKTDSNNGFNTTGLINLGDKQIKEVQEVNDIIDFSTDRQKFEPGGAVPNIELVQKIYNVLMPHSQSMAVRSITDIDEGRDAIANLLQALKDIPKLYAQDEKGKNAIAYMHYFGPSSDWYITEFDPNTNEAFGYVILNGDCQNSEFGYIDVQQFKKHPSINLDQYWKYKTINEILEKECPGKVSGPVEYYEETPTTKGEFFKGLNISDYKNEYDINRAIEEYLEDNPNRENWTIEEKKFLMHYSGYGGLGTQGEIPKEFIKGAKYEFYTPDEIVKKMWALAYKYGYGTGKLSQSVLEPSVATGNFFRYAPKGVMKVGFETNRYSAQICSILFPDAEISVMPFERLFIKRNLSVKNKIDDYTKFGLVIGNPPYAKAGSKYLEMGEQDYTHAETWVEYFILRGLDLLLPGGLLIYIVGAEQMNGGTMFLDSKPSKVKEMIHDRADLIDAYRLPRNVFDRTGVSSEIVVFKKRK